VARLTDTKNTTNLTGILQGNGTTISGVELKTINGNSLIGNGNITLTATYGAQASNGAIRVNRLYTTPGTYYYVPQYTMQVAVLIVGAGGGGCGIHTSGYNYSAGGGGGGGGTSYLNAQ
jgi:hypothetical protein